MMPSSVTVVPWCPSCCGVHVADFQKPIHTRASVSQSLTFGHADSQALPTPLSAALNSSRRSSRLLGQGVSSMESLSSFSSGLFWLPPLPAMVKWRRGSLSRRFVCERAGVLFKSLSGGAGLQTCGTGGKNSKLVGQVGPCGTGGRVWDIHHTTWIHRHSRLGAQVDLSALGAKRNSKLMGGIGRLLSQRAAGENGNSAEEEEKDQSPSLSSSHDDAAENNGGFRRVEGRGRAGGRVIELRLTEIRRPLRRVRQNDPEKVKMLMESISKIGLQVPIDVLEVEGKYYGFSGCHRFEAHIRLGLPTIRCKVHKASKAILRLHMM
ncbi:hypothetical protein CBR_g4 [Chara braunii]|uniref:sulfiredoxin n=1 Tax=Chara braunii TaxID=69332 RepID=A0A388JLI2_CHABU|nr:hypothetical protein CBR_g4 [Chara braunii]|eukprot:GBG58603.1 hypothetical protein CBR_g4 [Chara braunii]